MQAYCFDLGYYLVPGYYADWDCECQCPACCCRDDECGDNDDGSGGGNNGGGSAGDNNNVNCNNKNYNYNNNVNNCNCNCNCGGSGGGGGGGDDPGPGGKALTPNIVDGAVQCQPGDPKTLTISGTGGQPGNYVHVTLQNTQIGFDLTFPERDTADNLVAADGSWTATLRLDANTKNVIEILPNSYYATFSDSSPQRVERADSVYRQMIEILSCEKNEITFDVESGSTVGCVDGRLRLTGGGAAPFAEINFYLYQNSTRTRVYWYGDTADADGRWSTELSSAAAGPILGGSCIPSGEYTLFAYQTNDEGFLRESKDVIVNIIGCCPARSGERGSGGRVYIGASGYMPGSRRIGMR